jgi:adenine-specific DNA-methyltransferase
VALVKQALGERQEHERLRLRGIIQKLANATRGVPPALSAEQQAITRSIESTDAALRDIKAGNPLPFFLYRLHFASVYEEKDGFDIVIANPPYVSIEHMAAEYKTQLREVYHHVAAGRADLYVYFYARALQLLRTGGTLAFISSNKFFRAGYGKGLREVLQTATAMRTIIDFGDFPVFDAAAYPCIVLATNGRPAPDHTYRGLTAGPDIDLDKLGLALTSAGQTQTQSDGVQPPSGSAEASALVQRLMRMGTPLGTFSKGRMYRGVVSGLNEAFVIDQATRDRLVAEDPRSAEVLKPFLRGRDVSRYKLHRADTYLIYTYHGFDLTHYPAVESYLEPFRSRLEERVTRHHGTSFSSPSRPTCPPLSSPRSYPFGLASEAASHMKNGACTVMMPSTSTRRRPRGSPLCSILRCAACASFLSAHLFRMATHSSL